MIGRVEGREAVSADDLRPFLMRKFVSMFAVDGLPDEIFGGFGVEDQSVEVEDEGLNHDGIILNSMSLRATVGRVSGVLFAGYTETTGSKAILSCTRIASPPSGATCCAPTK